MRSRWEPRSIEIRFAESEPGSDDCLLAQTGQILYSYLCQLERESVSVETTWAASNMRRTGANG
jgi:hypothetical protein